MRHTTLALCVCTLVTTTSLHAQQLFALDGGRASFASRGSLGRSSGEIHQGFHGSHHRGLGDQGRRSTIDAVSFFIQDTNSATSETVQAVFRKGTDARGPSTVITRTGAFTTPPRGGGPSVWLVTTRTSSPAIVPSTGFFSVGVAVTALRGTSDGAYVHMGTISSCAHPRVQHHAWDVRGTIVQRVARPICWRIRLHSGNAVFLQHGNGGADYGMAGMFPKAGCVVTSRVRYKSTMAGGRSLLHGALGRTNGIPLFPNTAKLFLGTPNVFLGAVTIGRNGEAIHTLTRSMPVVTPGPTLHVQAAGATRSTVVLSNTQGITP